MALAVAGQDIEDDGLARQIVGLDGGVEDLDRGDIGRIGAQVVEQRHQQFGGLSKQPLEDVVVGGIGAT